MDACPGGRPGAGQWDDRADVRLCHTVDDVARAGLLQGGEA
ncbi:hypothetical protein [Streptosporangium sp. NPDC048865]